MSCGKSQGTMCWTEENASRLRYSNEPRDDGASPSVFPDFVQYLEFVPSDGQRKKHKNKRVWKACQRCRVKKIKCDGEFPCNRCKESQVVCIGGNYKIPESKRRSKGYAEILETNQMSLIAIIHKLYNMVRSGERWDLGEPELNDSGLPVIHDIASRLGAVQSYSDIELPLQVRFPEDEAAMAKLAQRVAEALQEGPPSPCDTDVAQLDTDPASAPSTAIFDPPTWLERILERATEIQGIISDQVARLQQLQSEQEQLQQMLRSKQMPQTISSSPGIGVNNFDAEPYLLPHMDADLMTWMDIPVTDYNFGYNV